MKTKIGLLFIATLFCFQLATAQSKQATHISMSAICDGQVSLWDDERAILNFNTSTQMLTMTSDLYEVTADHTRYEHTNPDDIDGIPVSMSTHLEIPNLEFKTAKNNGETFQFNALVKCNGREISVPATFTFLYAPRVAGSDLSDAPLCSFRIDVVISIQPKDFGLNTERGCNEIVMRIQDGLLNRVN